MPKRLSPEVERKARRLAAKGHGLREIGRMLACSLHAVTNVLDGTPGTTALPRPDQPTATRRAADGTPLGRGRLM